MVLEHVIGPHNTVICKSSVDMKTPNTDVQQQAGEGCLPRIKVVLPAAAKLLMAMPGVAVSHSAAHCLSHSLSHSAAHAVVPLTTQAVSSSSGSWLAAGQQQQQRWLPDKSAMQQAGLSSCSWVPEGVQSALVQPLLDGAVLLVLAERPRQVFL